MIPLVTAAAYRDRPSALSIWAASSGFLMLPSSMWIVGYWARFRPVKSARSAYEHFGKPSKISINSDRLYRSQTRTNNLKANDEVKSCYANPLRPQRFPKCYRSGS